MLFDDTYLTIEEPVEGIHRVSGSKFLSFAYPIKSETEIKPIIAKLKALHPQANHHCWAARLGSDQSAQRFNDDGEPAGSAGRPILNTLLSKRLTNIIVVVVRYFGGTLLGIPGLISAYKTTTEEALNVARIIEKTFNDIYQVNFDYLQMNEVMKVVKDQNLEVLETQFDIACVLKFSVRKTHINQAEQKLRRISDVKLTYLYSS
jgi:uncharacterized YigZ family protein